MSDSFKTSRRNLLGFASGALVLGLAGAGAAEQNTEVADAPTSDNTQQKQAFYGLHQAGIVTPRPSAGMMVGFDVIAQTPQDLERLLRTLTTRIAFLTKGGQPQVLDPKLPPADSGILGPQVSPDNLTITVSAGASLFANRDWLAPHKPLRLSRMTKFPNDALNADLCHGDLSLQFCANTVDTNIHALRDILKSMPDQLIVRWKQEGTVPAQRPRPDGQTESARNFLGFRDGSGNPDSTDDALMDQLVWVLPDSDEPSWATGGSYQVARIIRNFVERWDRTPLGEQEQIIGRSKVSGAPFTGTHESHTPDFASDPHGKITRLDAHMRLANPRTPYTEPNRILRRPFNYSNGIAKAGQLDQGLLFICYQADLEKGFVAVQRRLNGEPLEEYIKPVGGGFFFALPGVRDQNDYLGSTLIAAATSNSI